MTCRHRQSLTDAHDDSISPNRLVPLYKAHTEKTTVQLPTIIIQGFNARAVAIRRVPPWEQPGVDLRSTTITDTSLNYRGRQTNESIPERLMTAKYTKARSMIESAMNDSQPESNACTGYTTAQRLPCWIHKTLCQRFGVSVEITTSSVNVINTNDLNYQRERTISTPDTLYNDGAIVDAVERGSSPPQRARLKHTALCELTLHVLVRKPRTPPRASGLSKISISCELFNSKISTHPPKGKKRTLCNKVICCYNAQPTQR
jgi:hypothetical protein